MGAQGWGLWELGGILQGTHPCNVGFNISLTVSIMVAVIVAHDKFTHSQV